MRKELRRCFGKKQHECTGINGIPRALLVFSIVAICFFCFNSCTEIWGKWDNPVDPDAWTSFSASPSDGSETADFTPVLDWNDIDDAGSYELQISDTSEDLSLRPINSLTSSSYQIPSPLQPGIWYWRLRVKYRNGTYSGWFQLSFRIRRLIESIEVTSGTFNNGTSNVTLSRFLISKYEVTQDQYRTVIGSNPSNFNSNSDSGSRPVEEVTWYDAVEFCNKLSELEGLSKVYTISGRAPALGYPITNAAVVMDITKTGYRLPTEAEWEFAARGGNLSAGYIYSGSNDVGTVAWYDNNSTNTSHAVGTKAANELGLYDMSGNVYEWCWDWYGIYPSGAQTDPIGALSGSSRLSRGGSWYGDFSHCKSALRIVTSPGNRASNIGFRVLRRP